MSSLAPDTLSLEHSFKTIKMLLVKTYLKEVDGKGIGLFAAETILKDQKWHKDEDIFDRKYTREFVETNALSDFFRHYATYHKDTDTYYLCSDNARFVNHSECPNTFYDEKLGACVATRDIKKDEEITCDYRNVCDNDRDFGVDFEVK